MYSLKINFLALAVIFSLGQLSIAMEEEIDGKLHDSINAEFQCSICIETITPEQSEGVIVLMCSHYFHNDCLNGWRSRKDTCPNCRNKAIRAFRTFNDLIADGMLRKISLENLKMGQELNSAHDCIISLEGNLKENEAAKNKLKNDYKKKKDKKLKKITDERDQQVIQLKMELEQDREINCKINEQHFQEMQTLKIKYYGVLAAYSKKKSEELKKRKKEKRIPRLRCQKKDEEAYMAFLKKMNVQPGNTKKK